MASDNPTLYLFHRPRLWSSSNLILLISWQPTLSLSAPLHFVFLSADTLCTLSTPLTSFGLLHSHSLILECLRSLLSLYLLTLDLYLFACHSQPLAGMALVTPCPSCSTYLQPFSASIFSPCPLALGRSFTPLFTVNHCSCGFILLC